MNRLRIRHRLLLLAMLPTALVAVVLSAYFTLAGVAALDEELHARGQAIVHYLAPAGEYGVIAGHRGTLQALVQAAMQQPDVQAVTITEPGGQVLAISGRVGNRAWLDAPPGVATPGAGWIGFAAPIVKTSVEFEEFLDIPRPENPGAEPRVIGRVYVELATAGLAARKRELLQTGFAIVLAGLAVAALIALRIARGVSRPLGDLTQAVGAMAGGRLDVRVPERSGGELAVLERGFNEMAGRLEDVHRTLQQRIEDATAQLAYQARHDPLTGLINRREFEVRVESALQLARSGQVRFALCYLDLDQFKVVNDTCGHAAGDELLRQITHLLAGRLREGDLLARLGGDEFGLLIADVGHDDAVRVVEALRQLVEDFRFAWHDHVFVVGASIGLVLLDEDAKSLAEVLSAADQACYAAKDKGRNRIHVYQRDDRELAERRGEATWAARIARALEENRFLFYAQRIFPLQAGDDEVLHVELLLRMFGEEGEIIPPRAFLAAAERFDLMPAIDRWVVGAACAAIARLDHARAGRPLCVAINLSGGIDADTLLPLIADALAAHGVAPAALCVEIGEHVASQSLARTLKLVEGLRALGCRFGLDDFGSGLASFSSLRHLAPDYVKIDAGIVRDVAADKVSGTVARAIREMARDLGIRTVAEAVEDGATHAALRALGVDCAQGYWFEAPAPFDEAWVARLGREAPRVAGEVRL